MQVCRRLKYHKTQRRAYVPISRRVFNNFPGIDRSPPPPTNEPRATRATSTKAAPGPDVLYVYMYETHFSAHGGPLFSSGRGSLFAFSAAGYANGPRVLTVHVWAPAGLRGGWSGRSKSRDLASNHGIAFRLAKHLGTMETPQLKACALLPLYHVCTTPTLKLSNSLPCGSRGTTAVAHRALTFETATNGASVCVRVCPMFPVDPGKRSEKRTRYSREVQLIGCCPGGKTI